MKKPVHFQKFARNRRIERQGAGGISKFLFWGEDLSGSFQGAGGVGGLVAHMEKPDSAGWTAYYYHPDANGNIAAVTSPFRALAAKFSYDAFGRTVTQTGSKSGIDIHALNYRFSTKPMELELATSNSTLVPPPLSSGLYYYGYRFYSPNMGRWINKDPIQEKGGYNMYEFIRNNAIDFQDKLGLELQGDLKCCEIKFIIDTFTSGKEEPVVKAYTPSGIYNNPTGRTFKGTMTVICKNQAIFSADIQTGGLKTTNSSVNNGDDSATPGGTFSIKTERGGLQGFLINTAGTGRGSITKHYASYQGSHGCPTLTNQLEFNDFAELMAKTKAKGKDSVPITIQYPNIKPKGNRGNGRNDPDSVLKAVPL